LTTLVPVAGIQRVAGVSAETSRAIA
jgi:hypothetical protein